MGVKVAAPLGETIKGWSGSAPFNLPPKSRDRAWVGSVSANSDRIRRPTRRAGDGRGLVEGAVTEVRARPALSDPSDRLIARVRWSGVQAGVDLDDSELVHLEWWSGRWRGGLGVGATAGEEVAIAAEAFKGCGASTLNPLIQRPTTLPAHQWSCL